jgi:16S rRNA (cytidine1402-2'-O)-methyltransferase
LRVAARLARWVAENAKATRAFLKRVDAVCPFAQPIQEIAIVGIAAAGKAGPTARPSTPTGCSRRQRAAAISA